MDTRWYPEMHQQFANNKFPAGDLEWSPHGTHPEELRKWFSLHARHTHGHATRKQSSQCLQALLLVIPTHPPKSAYI